MNNTGQVVKRISQTNNSILELNVNLTDFPKGIYLIDLDIDGQRITRKLILD